MKFSKLPLIASALLAVASPYALAQDLVYTPTNPSFGGNPLNSSHLLNTASVQRQRTARDADDSLSATTTDDTSNENVDLFVRQLEGRLLSALAGQVTEAIFGDTPQDSGAVVFGTTTVEFEQSVSEIRLVITDSLDGTVTEIIAPKLVVE